MDREGWCYSPTSANWYACTPDYRAYWQPESYPLSGQHGSSSATGQEVPLSPTATESEAGLDKVEREKDEVSSASSEYIATQKN